MYATLQQHAKEQRQRALATVQKSSKHYLTVAGSAFSYVMFCKFVSNVLKFVSKPR
jgi:hypothetical protein